MTDADRVRLHITPFNPDLYDRVVSASAKAVATGLSYHSVQTYPERGFGYIELPRMEADKLKKKIHGFTLKGSKVRVEEAKPEKKRKADRDETEEERKERKKAKKEKKEKKEKAKREDGVIPGYELEEGRHVKRGWSEGKGKTKTKDQKMHFKTSIPPNAMPIEDEKKRKSKEKKAKREDSKDGERKSHKTPKVVEEFAKKKPVIISAEVDAKAAAQYVEGKGWVDENGQIIEAEPPSVKRQRAKERAMLLMEEARLAEEQRRETEAEAMEVDVQDHTEKVAEEHSEKEDSDEDEIDSASSMSDDDQSEDEDTVVADQANPVETSKVAPVSTNDSTTPVPEAAREVHPLEALYKRAPNTTGDDATKHNLAPINTSFSFFNAEDVEDDEEESAANPAHAPQTPHTKQDLEWRALRSAAPTPDTAGLGKRFRFAMDGAERDEDGDSNEDSDEDMADDVSGPVGTARAPTNAGDKEESEFRKWFYEHRGENNRAWKKKRKEAKKQQRQRENRRLTRRVV